MVLIFALNGKPTSPNRTNGKLQADRLLILTAHEALAKQKAADEAELAKERRLQDALLSIKKQFGKNAVLKAMSLQEGATAKDRNRQVGGHKA